jgi:hypothetical protein
MKRSEVRNAIDFFHKLAREKDSAYYMQRAIEISQFYTNKPLA